MKHQYTMLLALLLAIAAPAQACHFCLATPTRQQPQGKTTLSDPAQDNYDIKHLEFHLQLTDTNVYIQGNVTTTAQVTAASMRDYFFELDTAMHVDSAFVNGTLLPVATVSGFLRRIALPVPLYRTAIFAARIVYHGMAPSGTGFFNGVTHAVSAGGTHMVYTVSDPWVAKDWWPCKQSILDQADSVDMFVTVPSGVADGSNGVLVGIDTVSLPGYSTYHWQTHYPIDYYLISVAVARYREYRHYQRLTGSTDSVLIQNFFLDTATFTPAYKANFDSVGLMLDYFSTLFGRYPFWREKYGMCFTALPGGMEHQTMTTIGVTDTRTIAHELCHQWFGDHVTYETWGDVWLSEGFATWSEQLFFEHFWSPAAARAHRQAYLSSATSSACGQVYVTDTTSPVTLFNQATVYRKGQAIVTMLRYIAPTDSQFFQVLRDYQHHYGFKNASTGALKELAESVYGFNLDTFFNQWVYGKGHPLYRITWNQAGSKVFVKLMQSTSCPASTPHFSTHLQLRLQAAGMDTTIRVYNSVDTQVFSFDWAPTVTGVLLNPDAVTICKLLGAATRDTRLGLGSNQLPGKLRIHPNPTKTNWQMTQLPPDTELTLLDMQGRLLWTGNSQKGTTTIPGDRLPAGEYLLHAGDDCVKLVHW